MTLCPQRTQNIRIIGQDLSHTNLVSDLRGRGNQVSVISLPEDRRKLYVAAELTEATTPTDSKKSM